MKLTLYRFARHVGFAVAIVLIFGSISVRADTQNHNATCDSKDCYDIYAVNTKGTKFELTESCKGTKSAYGFSCSSPSVPVTCSHTEVNDATFTCTCNAKEQKVKYSVHASMDCR